jgi:hypothetical protein
MSEENTEAQQLFEEKNNADTKSSDENSKAVGKGAKAIAVSNAIATDGEVAFSYQVKRHIVRRDR